MEETLGSTQVDRRRLLMGAGLGGGGLALGLLGAAAPAAADGGGHSAQGAWQVKVKETGSSMTTTAVVGFAAGGVFTAVDIAPPGPTGIGAWKSTGSRSYRVTFWQAGVENGKVVGTVKIRVWGKVDGDKTSGTFKVWVYDTSGKLVGTSDGTFTGDRISA